MLNSLGLDQLDRDKPSSGKRVNQDQASRNAACPSSAYYITMSCAVSIWQDYINESIALLSFDINLEYCMQIYE